MVFARGLVRLLILVAPALICSTTRRGGKRLGATNGYYKSVAKLRI